MYKFENAVKREIISISYKEVNRVITEFYALPLDQFGRGYEVVAYEEWSNYESHEFDLDGDIDSLDVGDAMKLMRTKKPEMYQTSTYLNYMVQEGAIEAGTYLVEIYW